MKPSFRLALTHGLALAVGWVIYQTMGLPEPVLTRESPPRPSSSSGRMPVADISGQGILDKVLKEVKQEKPAFYNPGAPSEAYQVSQKIRDRIDNIEIPADFARALESALASAPSPWTEDQKATIIALSYQWIARDPEGYFRWACGSDEARRRSMGSVMFNVDTELYRRGGIPALMELLGKADRLESQVSADLGRILVRNGDMAGMMNLESRMEPVQWKNFLQMAGLGWPDSKQSDLVKLAVRCDVPAMVIAYYSNRKNSGQQLATLLTDESLPENFRKQVADDPQVRDLLINDPTVPLATRLGFGANPWQMVNGDVSRLLTQDRDWPFAFRNGEATAQEIMDRVIAGTPELAKKEPAALRMQVFRELAEENPAAAMSLLQDLPEDERSDQVLYASRTHFNDVEPDKFIELLQQIPANTPEQWEDRLDTWNRRSFTNNERLQEGYVEWVQALPPSLDREMALYSLARAVNESNPQLAANLRGQVSDPALQQRISKHR